VRSFLYFVPDRDTPPDRQELVRLGIDYAFDGQPEHRTSTSTGPGPESRGGVVLAQAGTDLRHVGYWPERQQWKPLPGGRGVMLGWFTDEPMPGPDDLARPRALQISGVPIVLADGRQWEVPTARISMLGDDGRVQSCDPRLPRRYEMSEAGELSAGDVSARWRWLWEVACRYFDWWHAATIEKDQSIPADYPTAVLDAVRALKANYRLGPREAVELELFEVGGVHVYLALNVLIGAFNPPAATQEDDSKKKQAAGSA